MLWFFLWWLFYDLNIFLISVRVGFPEGLVEVVSPSSIPLYCSSPCVCCLLPGRKQELCYLFPSFSPPSCAFWLHHALYISYISERKRSPFSWKQHFSSNTSEIFQKCHPFEDFFKWFMAYSSQGRGEKGAFFYFFLIFCALLVSVSELVIPVLPSCEGASRFLAGQWWSCCFFHLFHSFLLKNGPLGLFISLEAGQEKTINAMNGKSSPKLT